MFRYCSREHQVVDWTVLRHKELCGLTTPQLENDSKQFSNHEEFEEMGNLFYFLHFYRSILLNEKIEM